MKITIDDIQEDVSVLELECGAAEIGLEAEGIRFTGPVTAKLKLFKQDDGVFIRAELSVSIESECAKCLVPVHRILEGTLESQYQPLPEKERDILDDAGIGYYSGEHIELSEDIVESLLLELPARIVCSEDCKGLCPKCGQNLNEAECDCRLQPEEVQTSKFANLIKTLEIDKKLEV